MSKLIRLHHSIFFSFPIIILTLTSCDADGTLATGTYEGQIISKTVQDRNNDIQIHIDTFEIRVFFTSDSFEVGDCSGSLTRLRSRMVLASEDCDCWCDCDPSVDCSGHPILGDFDILSDDDTLVLNALYEQEASVGNNVHKWSLEKTATFYK